MKVVYSVIVLVIALGCTVKEQEKQKELWFSSPAKRWFEANPIGNGMQGGMIYGGVKEELISLTENTYFSGEVSDHIKEGASDYMPAIRQALLSKDYELTNSLSKNIIGKKGNYGTNLPLVDLKVIFGHGDQTKYYKRSLNLNDAMVRVDYEIDEVNYSREYLASNPDGVIAFRFMSDKSGALNFDIIPDGLERPIEISNSDNNLVFQTKAREQRHSDGQTGVDAYSIVSVIDNDGSSVIKNGKLSISGASNVTILIAMSTSFAGNDPEKSCTNKISSLRIKSFEQIRKDHVRDYKNLYDRMHFSLGADSLKSMPTDQRVKRVAKGGTDHGLIPLMYQYARYLTISSGRANSVLPNHLQGIWNDNIACQIGWTCDMHLDINTQMNYWLTETTNLQECGEPLFNWIENTLVPSGIKTAREVYGADGWVAHTVSNPWGFTAPGWSTYWGVHPTAGAWIAAHLWDHYEFTGDEQFLKERAYPVLKSSVEFFMDYMFEDSTGYMVTGPACSPENSFQVDGKGYVLDMMPTSDIAIIKALFEQCIKGAKTLGVDAEFVQRLESFQKKLPPYQIDSKGRLQEWYFDHEESLPNHRHMTHLLSVFPYSSIKPEFTPALADAAWKSVLSRTTPKDKWEDTGWARSVLILNSARLWKTEDAYENVMDMIRLITEDNLMVIHPPTAGANSNVYELDGNTGMCMGVTEMLLQSHFKASEIVSEKLDCNPDTPVIHLLPALPSKWPKGEIKGLIARGGFEVDMNWENGVLSTAKITSKTGNSGVLRYNDQFVVLDLKAGKSYSWVM